MRPSDRALLFIEAAIWREAWRDALDIEGLILLFAGIQLHDPDVVTWALDDLYGNGHNMLRPEVRVVPRSELSALDEDDPTPIPLLSNGDPDFAYVPKIKVYPEFWAPLAPLGPVIEDGLPLLSERDLRLIFAAHGRQLSEATLQQINKWFRGLRADWRQTAEQQVDDFIRELREYDIGPRDGERLARERGLDLSRSTISRRLRAL